MKLVFTTTMKPEVFDRVTVLWPNELTVVNTSEDIHIVQVEVDPNQLGALMADISNKAFSSGVLKERAVWLDWQKRNNLQNID